MIGIVLANIARPSQRAVRVRLVDRIDMNTKHIAIGSNMPQTAETIITNGEKSQKQSTRRAS
jgi:hypothetical protein